MIANGELSLANPVSHAPADQLKGWLRYLEFKAYSSRAERFLIYERALKVLPGR